MTQANLSERNQVFMWIQPDYGIMRLQMSGRQPVYFKPKRPLTFSVKQYLSKLSTTRVSQPIGDGTMSVPALLHSYLNASNNLIQFCVGLTNYFKLNVLTIIIYHVIT